MRRRCAVEGVVEEEGHVVAGRCAGGGDHRHIGGIHERETGTAALIARDVDEAVEHDARWHLVDDGDVEGDDAGRECCIDRERHRLTDGRARRVFRSWSASAQVLLPCRTPTLCNAVPVVRSSLLGPASDDVVAAALLVMTAPAISGFSVSA